MPAKLCNVTFFEPGSDGQNFNTYILMASTIPDTESIISTVGSLDQATPMPEATSIVLEIEDLDAALREMEHLVEGLDVHEGWIKLSTCP